MATPRTRRHYANCATLDAHHDVHLAWSVDDAGGRLHLATWAPVPDGYLAVGLSEDGSMTGGPRGFAEVWVVRAAASQPAASSEDVPNGGRDLRCPPIRASAAQATSSDDVDSACHPACLLDGVVREYSVPTPDAAAPASLEDVQVTRTPSHLIAEFSRALDTGKAATDYAIALDAPTTLIWALHGANRAGGLSALEEHAAVGQATVTFGAGQPCPPGTVGSPPRPATAPNPFATRDNAFALAWNASAEAITFTMSSAFTGWVAIGLNNKPTMAGADMYVGWVGRKTGNVVVLDTHGTGRETPVPDTEGGGSSDVYDVRGSLVRARGIQGARLRCSGLTRTAPNARRFAAPQADGRLTVTFTRPLATGDARDWQITDEPVFLLYGYSDQLVRQGRYAKHRDFGITRVQLLDTTLRPRPQAAAEAAEAAAAPRGPPVLLLLAVAASIALLAWRWMQRARSAGGKAAASSGSKAADEGTAAAAAATGTAARRRARQTTTA